MAKKLIIFFIVLASLELFNLSAFETNSIKVFQIIGIGTIVLITLIHLVYPYDNTFIKNFNVEIFLMFAALTLSMFMAQWGHGQSVTTTLIAQRFMYFYLVYYALHAINISLEDLQNIILSIAIAFSLLYLLQFMLYPNILLDVRITDDRNTIRIFMPGFTYLILAYFMILNQLFKYFSLSKLFIILMFLSILILMGTRQIIFTMILLTLMSILFSRMVKSKILVFILVALSVTSLIIIFQDIFVSLLDLSKHQSKNIAENVRIKAAIFFLTELFPNKFSYITGNGADSTNSIYGTMIQMYRDAFGFYQSDIGIIGDYTKFGLPFIIGSFMILYKAIRWVISDGLVYIKYFYICTLLLLFTGGGPFAQADSIVAICMTLYLLDVDRNDQKLEEIEKDMKTSSKPNQ